MDPNKIARLVSKIKPQLHPVSFEFDGEKYDVFFRKLNLVESNAIFLEFVDEEKRQILPKIMPKYQAAIFAATIRDENDEPIFQSSDIEGCDPDFYRMVDKLVAQHNPTAGDLEAAAKNSETTPANGS